MFEKIKKNGMTYLTFGILAVVFVLILFQGVKQIQTLMNGYNKITHENREE